MRRRMSNEQRWSGLRRSIEIVKWRCESHMALTLTYVPVGGNLYTSTFPLLLQFQMCYQAWTHARDFPLASPQRKVSGLGQRVGGLTWGLRNERKKAGRGEYNNTWLGFWFLYRTWCCLCLGWHAEWVISLKDEKNSIAKSNILQEEKYSLINEICKPPPPHHSSWFFKDVCSQKCTCSGSLSLEQ